MGISPFRVTKSVFLSLPPLLSALACNCGPSLLITTILIGWLPRSRPTTRETPSAIFWMKCCSRVCPRYASPILSCSMRLALDRLRTESKIGGNGGGRLYDDRRLHFEGILGGLPAVPKMYIHIVFSSISHFLRLFFAIRFFGEYPFVGRHVGRARSNNFRFLSGGRNKTTTARVRLFGSSPLPKACVGTRR